MGLVKWSAAGLLFVLASPSHAAVDAKWLVAVATPEYYQTAQAACQRQHDYYAAENPGPVTAAPYKGSYSSSLCDWKTHVDGDYPWNPLPTLVLLRCVDENNQSVAGYRLEPPGICVAANEPPASRPPCEHDKSGRANPTVGNPIVVSNGAKFESHLDYEDSDKRLKIQRTYRSRYGNGDASFPVYPVPRGVGDIWKLNWQWEMKLYAQFAYGGYFGVSTPDGSNYAFELKTDGTIAPRNEGVTDLTVEYINPGGSGAPVSLVSVLTNGGQFRISTSAGDRVTIQLYRRWGTEYLDGHTTQIVFRGGYTWNMVYGSQDQLTSITDSLGRTISFTWYYSQDANDTGTLNPRAIQFIDLPDGTRLSYTYEDYSGAQAGSQRYERFSGFQRIAPNSTVVDGATYLYEDPTLPTALTGIIDHAGVRYATFAYDAAGHAISSKHAGDVDQTTITYTHASISGVHYHYRTVTNALGKATKYTFKRIGVNSLDSLLLSVEGQPSTNCVGTARSLSYTNNRITTSTDEAGVQTRYTYGSDQRVQTKTEAYGTSLQKVTTYTWDATFGVPTQISTPGLTQNFTHDSAGRLTTRTEIDTTNHSVPYVTNGTTRTWTYTYNTQGLVATVDGPLAGTQDTTLYEYNSAGYLRKVTNAAAHVWEVTSFDGAGRPLQFEDPNGAITTLSYDGNGHLATRSIAGIQTAYEYNLVGNLSKVTFPGGAWLQYTYDNARRLTDIHDQLGNHVQYQLDAAGNRTQQNVYDPFNVLHSTQARVYDELSRLLRVQGAELQTTQFAYDLRGNLISEIKPSTATTARLFDRLNRLAQVTDPGSGITQYGYNALGQLTSVTDPRGKMTAYTYNGFGDLIQQISPDTGMSVFTYDGAGNVLTRLDARGRTRTYGYDVLDRVTSITDSDQTIGYTYDTGTNQNGRLTQISDGSGSTIWTYDSVGRVLSRQQIMGGITKNVAYAYDAHGRLQTLTLPSGNVVTYGYTNGQLTSATLNGVTTILSNVLYQPFGSTRGWTWGNSSFAIREYDLNGLIRQIDSAGLKTYSYDGDFRVTQIADASNAALSQSYGYDPQSRLASATGTGLNQSWTYDANGNRLTQGGNQSSTYTIASTSNRVASITGSLTRTYAYDSAGNTTSDGTSTFVYNDAGRMVSATKAGVTTTYATNALGQRIKKTAGTVSRYFVYDEAGRLLGEYDNAGALIQETIWFSNIPVATIRPNGSDVELFYVHVDHLNTPRRITRPSDNAIVWRWDSDPFGTSAPVEDPDGDSHLFVYHVRFPGQYYDLETGLHYNYFRDFDPATGRYVQSDPIGLGGGLNTYAYVDGSPIWWIDPLGLDGCQVDERAADEAETRRSEAGEDLNNARFFQTDEYINNARQRLDYWTSRYHCALCQGDPPAGDPPPRVTPTPPPPPPEVTPPSLID